MSDFGVAKDLIYNPIEIKSSLKLVEKYEDLEPVEIELNTLKYSVEEYKPLLMNRHVRPSKKVNITKTPMVICTSCGSTASIVDMPTSNPCKVCRESTVARTNLYGKWVATETVSKKNPWWKFWKPRTYQVEMKGKWETKDYSFKLNKEDEVFTSGC